MSFRWACAVKGWLRENTLFAIGTLITSVLVEMHMVAYHPDAHLEKAMNSVTIIETPEGTGTGFFISPDGCMLTAAHVVDNSSGTVLPVQFMEHGDLHMYGGVVVRSNPYLDIAYVCPSSPTFVPPAYLRVVDTENIRRGDRVYALGDTAGRTWNLTEGIISRYGYKIHSVQNTEQPLIARYDLWFTAFISWGNSGGPIINAHGDVVGMCIEYDDPARAGHPNGMNIAVPGTDLLRFVRTIHGD